MNQNNYDAQLALLEGDNVNVCAPNDGKSFWNLILKIFVIVMLIFVSCDFISSVFIDFMPTKTQFAIENILSSDRTLKMESSLNVKYEKELYLLNDIKQKIINEDKLLRKKSDFNIKIIEDKDINAFIAPNGTIYFTGGMLDENFSEQELAFVLAHEMGHYVHRDHLKSVSRKLMLAAIFSLVGKDNGASVIVNNISDTTNLSHSRGQEKKADLYASDMLKKIYGTNQGGISFINKIKDKEKLPEFLYYFSTHPSWKARLKYIS